MRGQHIVPIHVLGVRLNWDKRYITLGPVATLLGLAFRLYDPEKLLGDKEDLGITCALVPTQTPGVNIGQWCSLPMVALSRAVSRKHAMQMLLTGRLYDAQTAMRMGLVNEVVPDAQLDAAVDELADEIAGKSAFTVALGKQAFYRQLDFDLAGAYDYAGEVAVRNKSAHDAEEGVRAFLEKRKPQWKGR